jgi:hypothetical protein
MFSAISLVYQFWIHTELIGRMGPLEWVMNTPSHHRVHHATNPKYLDANYAGVLIIWDRMFGTFVAEDDKEKPHYGIVSQLGTFNPFRVAFHEWLGIWRDVTHAKSLPRGARLHVRPARLEPRRLAQNQRQHQASVGRASASFRRRSQHRRGMKHHSSPDARDAGSPGPIDSSLCLWPPDSPLRRRSADNVYVPASLRDRGCGCGRADRAPRAPLGWRADHDRRLTARPSPRTSARSCGTRKSASPPATSPAPMRIGNIGEGKRPHRTQRPRSLCHAGYGIRRKQSTERPCRRGITRPCTSLAVEWFDDPARLEAIVRDLSNLHERGRAAPWADRRRAARLHRSDAARLRRRDAPCRARRSQTQTVAKQKRRGF